MADGDRRGISLQWQMLIGFLVGLTFGLIAYSTQKDAVWVEFVTTYVTTPIGQIFLRLMFMLVIPLLFSALIVGISEMGEVKSLKRVGLRTLAYTVVVSSIAVAVSLAVVNLLKPGTGVDRAAAAEMLAQSSGRASEIVKSSAEQPAVATRAATTNGARTRIRTSPPQRGRSWSGPRTGEHPLAPSSRWPRDVLGRPSR